MGRNPYNITIKTVRVRHTNPLTSNYPIEWVEDEKEFLTKNINNGSTKIKRTQGSKA